MNGHPRFDWLRPKGAKTGTRAASFDHFVGAGEQKMRDCDLAELARVNRVNFPKAICA
jgi:hypothetical protein